MLGQGRGGPSLKVPWDGSQASCHSCRLETLGNRALASSKTPGEGV